MDWIHLAQGRDQVVSCYEHGNETSSFIKDGKFRNYLSEY